MAKSRNTKATKSLGKNREGTPPPPEKSSRKTKEVAVSETESVKDQVTSLEALGISEETLQALSTLDKSEREKMCGRRALELQQTCLKALRELSILSTANTVEQIRFSWKTSAFSPSSTVPQIIRPAFLVKESKSKSGAAEIALKPNTNPLSLPIIKPRDLLDTPICDGIDHARVLAALGRRIAFYLAGEEFKMLRRGSDNWPVLYSGECDSEILGNLLGMEIGLDLLPGPRLKRQPFDMDAQRNRALLYHLRPMLEFFIATHSERMVIKRDLNRYYDNEYKTLVKSSKRKPIPKWWHGWQKELGKTGFKALSTETIKEWFAVLMIKIEAEHPDGIEKPPAPFLTFPEQEPDLSIIGESTGKMRVDMENNRLLEKLKNPDPAAKQRMAERSEPDIYAKGVVYGIENGLKTALERLAGATSSTK